MPVSWTTRRMRAWVAPMFSLLLVTGYTVAQSVAVASNSKRSHPAPGTSIVRFAEVDQDVYKGSKPKTEADYRFLQSKNVRTVVDIKLFPLLYRFEKKRG